MSDDVLELQQPLTADGIRSVNFFNGRLLTGRDLTREQQARREADTRLGLARGDGVAFGLDVVSDGQPPPPALPVVSVTPGLAISRTGRTLRLGRKVTINLARRFEAPAADRLFGDCTPIVGGSYIAGAGVCLLTIAPAELPEGRANSNALDPANVRCATDVTVEGVQFRLILIRRAAYAGLDTGAETFRNELAYRCFGAGIDAAWFGDLLRAASRGDDLLETARQSEELTDEDVPLALLFLAGAEELRFIDVWSARRPLAEAGGAALPSLARPRRIAVGEAMFRQFQQQVDELATPGAGLGSVTAASHFRYLPPAGLIPVRADAPGESVEATRFFAGMTIRGPAFLNAAQLEGLIRESVVFPRIDVRSGEMIWLYRIRENHQPPAAPGPPPARLPGYVVFASGHLPYRANARYDLAYFDYANYAIDD